MGLKVACPGCGAGLTVPAEVAGKTGRCRKCGATFVVPVLDATAGDEVPASTPPPDNPAPREASETPTRPIVCLFCGGELDPDAVICVHCGLDLRTGKALSTQVGAEASGTSPTSRLAPTPQRGGKPTLLALYGIANIVLPVFIVATIFCLMVWIGAAFAVLFGGAGVVLGLTMFLLLILASFAILTLWFVLGVGLFRGRKWGLGGLAVLFFQFAVVGILLLHAEGPTCAPVGRAVLVYVAGHLPLFLSGSVRRYVS